MNKIKAGTGCGSFGPCRHDWEVTALVNTADYFTGMYTKIIAISLLNINCEIRILMNMILKIIMIYFFVNYDRIQ